MQNQNLRRPEFKDGLSKYKAEKMASTLQY